MFRDCSTKKDTPATKPVDDQQRSKVKAHVYAITKRDAKASKAVVIGTIPLFAYIARALIDPRSTHSFISYAYAKHASSLSIILDYMLVFTPHGKSLLVDLVIKSCAIMIGNLELSADLILLNMKDFDVILGMDWLAAYHAMVHCYSKEVVFHIPRLAEFSFKGVKKDYFPCLISSIQIGKIL